MLDRRTLVASAARSSNGNSGLIDTGQGASAAVIELDVTAASGVLATLDVYLQMELADGINFGDIAHFAQVLQAAIPARRVIVMTPGAAALEGVALNLGLPVATVLNVPLIGKYQVAWVLGGTTPNFTFSVSADFQN